MKRKIILVHESILQSITKDLFTFIMFFGVLWANYKLLENNKVTALFFLSLIIVSMLIKSNTYINNSKVIKTKKEAEDLIGKYITD